MFKPIKNRNKLSLQKMTNKPNKGEVIIVILELVIAVMKGGKKLSNLYQKKEKSKENTS